MMDLKCNAYGWNFIAENIAFKYKYSCGKSRLDEKTLALKAQGDLDYTNPVHTYFIAEIMQSRPLPPIFARRLLRLFIHQ